MVANLLGARWGHVKAAFFPPPLSVYFGDNTSYSSTSTQRGYFSSTVWHIFVRVQHFLLLHTIFLHSLRGGIFVWICTLKHIINNPVCSKWMTCPSVAVISWTATSLSKVGTQENSWNIEGIRCSAAVSPYVKYSVDKADFGVLHRTSLSCVNDVRKGIVSVYLVITEPKS